MVDSPFNNGNIWFSLPLQQVNDVKLKVGRRSSDILDFTLYLSFCSKSRRKRSQLNGVCSEDAEDVVIAGDVGGMDAAFRVADVVVADCVGSTALCITNGFNHTWTRRQRILETLAIKLFEQKI